MKALATMNITKLLLNNLTPRSPRIQQVISSFQALMSNKTTAVYFTILLIVLLMGIFGPYVTPYEFDERVVDNNGIPQTSQPPSLSHPLGTTDLAYDVFSRLLYGARPTVITGILGGAIIATTGLTVGIISGYFGGIVDEALMRFTDLMYGIPLIPFALVLATLFGIGFWSTIIIIGLVLWRSSARVIRSQVLQIKQRPYIQSAKAIGASPFSIIIRHILPNVGAMAILFFAIGIGYSIVAQASLAFIGITSPFVPSWGVILRNAYKSGLMADFWWWSLPPGILLSVTVLAAFMFGRGFEEISNDNDQNIEYEGV